MSPLINSIDCNVAARCNSLEKRVNVLQAKAEYNALLTAKLLIHRIRNLQSIDNIQEAEFKVFSQWGEDGIIQYLIHHVSIPNKVFVEFGVEDYSEANTRFLLMNNNWEGLVIDADPELPGRLKSQELYWRYNLTARVSFITAENINNLIRDSGIHGDIGLLSVDIDGNDYWVWKAIDVISPRIVICEYNSVFGDKHQITVTYKPDFYKTDHHYSNLCFGASLAAICRLAEEKGYVFVGSNSEGCNAFFVRKDIAIGLPRPAINEGYAKSKFRASIDDKGLLTFLSGNQRANAIADAQVFNVATNQLVRIGDLGEL
jgi:hypothetical protein